MEISLFSLENNAIDMCLDNKLPDLDYVDCYVSSSEGPKELQTFLTLLNNNVFEERFAITELDWPSIQTRTWVGAFA